MKKDKIITFLKRNFLLLTLILIIPVFFSLLRPGFFFMQDDLQAFRIQQMDKCIKDLQIPCRWVPDPGYQYGYPQFEYYPPSVYYIGEVFHLLGFQFIDSVKILFILGFILSALAMFVFLKSLFGDYPAFMGAILYTYAPYKAVDVYVRGAMSEFWSFVFFPLIFWAAYMLIKSGKLRYIAWFGLSSGLLLLTHNLMSIIFFPLVGIWSLSWIIVEKKYSLIPKLVLAGLLGLGFAAFFTLPVAFERQYAHLESLVGGYFDYRQHFVDLSQLFISNHWGYGSSYLGPGDDLSLSTGIIQWVLGLLGVVLAIINFKKNRKLAYVILVIFVTELFVLFMTHQKSSFIWDRIQILTYLQFPWRILADSVFLLSFLGAFVFYSLKDLKLKYFFGVLIILLLFVLHGSFFKPMNWLNITDNDKFSGKSWEKQLTISIFDYLPIYAKLPPIHKAPAIPEVLSGDVEISNYKKGSNFQTGNLLVNKVSRVRLPLFDFPGMKVKVNGIDHPHINNDCSNEEFCLGLITFDLVPGNYQILAKLYNTPLRNVANSLSLASILTLGFLFFKGYKKIHG